MDRSKVLEALEMMGIPDARRVTSVIMDPTQVTVTRHKRDDDGNLVIENDGPVVLTDTYPIY